MKTHTSNFKNEIKLLGKEIDSKITFGSTVLGKDDLNSVTPSFQGSILKSVMKELDIDSNVDIPLNTVLKYEFGVKVNGEYEYINFGNYVVYKSEKQEDTNSYRITCYDKMLYSMKEYEKMNITYPITLRNYINAVCSHLGLTFKDNSGTFANYNRTIQNELYIDKDGNSLGYTFRDVFDELAQATASTICINNNDELEIRYINDTGDTIDEEFLRDVNVNFGEKFGAVNTIVLSRSAESDNVYYPETLPTNPYELKIVDNQIMNGNDRADYLPDIYNKLNGLEFYINDFSSTGICYYDLCDRYNVKVGDKTYSCVMFNDEILVTQGLRENVFTDMPKETKTDYTKADKTDRRINQTNLIVDKQNQEIQALVETVKDIEVDTTLTKQASGNPITIEDAGAYPCENFIVEGKSEQETTNGYQLVDFNNPTGTSDPESYSFDGETLTYTSAGDRTYGNVHFNILDIIKNNPGKTLYFSFESYDFSNGKNACVQLNLTNNGTSSYLQMVQTSGKVNIINIPEDTSGYTFAILAIYSNNSTTTGTSYSVTIKKPMLSFTENASYEKYTGGVAGPNPQYPSEIKTVKGIENIFDGLIELGRFNTNTGQKYEDTTAIRNTNFINVEPNTIYVFSLDGVKLTAQPRYFFYDKDKNFLSSIVPTDGGIIETPNNCYYVNWHSSYLYEIYGTELPKPMIEEGTTAHPFVPYGRYLYNKITGKNILNNQDYSLGTIYEGNGNDSPSTTNYRFNTYIPVKPNTQIYLLKKLCIYYYDKDKKYISYDIAGNLKPITPNNTAYVRFRTFGADFETFNNEDYMVSYEPITSYEPYKEKIITYDLKKENLFDGEFRQGNAYDESITNRIFSTQTLYIEKGKTCTFKTNLDTSIFRYAVYMSDKPPIFTDIFYNSGWLTSSSFSFNASANGYVGILIGRINDSNLTPNDVSNFDFKLYEGTGTDDYYELVSINDIKDELDEASGKLNKRIGKIVLDRTQNITTLSDGVNGEKRFRFSDSTIKNIPNNVIGCICNKYKGVTYNNTKYIPNSISVWSEQNIFCITTDSKTKTLAEFKQELADEPAIVYYELAEPETIQLEPTEIELFKGTNNIYTLDDLEPNMNITYLTDTKSNAQYATKSELKIAEGRIESGINATLQEYSKTTEMKNIISQEVSESTNQILLEVENKIDEEVTGANILLEINNDTSSATINADKINLNGVVTANNTFKINTDGSMEATGGKIGGWSIKTDDIYNSASGISSNLGKYAFWAGETNSANGTVDTDAKFRVGHDGSIHATAGRIGGWNITTGYLDYTFENGDRVMLANGSNEYKDVLVCYVGGQVPFYLHSDGYLHASNANITGTITSSSGTIGGFTLGSYSLSGSTTNGSMRIQRGSSASVDLPANGGRLMLGSTNTNGVALTTASTLVISDTYDHVTTGHDLATIGIRALNGHVRIASNDTVNINAPTFVVNGSAGWTGYLDVRDADGSTKLRLNFKSGICTGYTRL